VGPSLARVLLDHWLASEFEGGKSLAKVAKVRELDGERGRSRDSA
jgi:ribose 5-phosphate isomerase RpiB